MEFLNFRIILFLIIIILQTCYNYMILFYNEPSYINVIKEEWELRNSACYIQNIETGVQHQLTIFTYIF